MLLVYRQNQFLSDLEYINVYIVILSQHPVPPLNSILSKNLIPPSYQNIRYKCITLEPLFSQIIQRTNVWRLSSWRLTPLSPLLKKHFLIMEVE